MSYKKLLKQYNPKNLLNRLFFLLSSPLNNKKKLTGS